MSNTGEKTIHSSSLTTDQLRQKASLEKAVELIREYKSGGSSQEIIDLIQGVIREQNRV